MRGWIGMVQGIGQNGTDRRWSGPGLARPGRGRTSPAGRPGQRTRPARARLRSVRLLRPHGLGIASMRRQAHLRECRQSAGAARCRMPRGQRSVTGSMGRAKDRMIPAMRAVTRQSPLSVKQQEIVKWPGVTLASFAGRKPRFYGIVEKLMTFSVDVESSPDETRPKSGEFPLSLWSLPPPRIRSTAAGTPRRSVGVRPAPALRSDYAGLHPGV